MHTFRRHIDALSPEARREVMDRARRHDNRPSPGATADPGIGTAGRWSNRPDDGDPRDPNDGGSNDGGSNDGGWSDGGVDGGGD